MWRSIWGVIMVVSLSFALTPSEKFDKGMAYLFGNGVSQDKNKALQYLSEAADDGSCEAEYNLALMYYSGDGVDQNITKALHYLENSAKAGYAKAVQNVGRVYMQRYEFDKAIPWLKRNAKGDDVQAYYLLAEIYVAKGDKHTAKQYAKEAIEQGSDDAKILWQQEGLANY